MWLEVLDELGIGAVSWNGESWSFDAKTVNRLGSELESPAVARYELSYGVFKFGLVFQASFGSLTT